MDSIEEIDIAMATELWETLDNMNASRDADIAIPVMARVIAAARGIYCPPRLVYVFGNPHLRSYCAHDTTGCICLACRTVPPAGRGHG